MPRVLTLCYCLALPAIAAADLVPTAAPAGCGRDADCKGDRVCEGGTCVSPHAAAPSMDELERSVQQGEQLLQKSGPSFVPPADVVVSFSRACDGGVARGCYWLGVLHVNGRGVAKDADKGLALINKACDQNVAMACNHMGMALRLSTSQHSQAEARYLQKACDLGDSLGCANIALAYDMGWAVPKNLKEAKRLNQKACQLGYAPACDAAEALRSEKWGFRLRFPEAPRETPSSGGRTEFFVRSKDHGPGDYRYALQIRPLTENQKGAPIEPVLEDALGDVTKDAHVIPDPGSPSLDPMKFMRLDAHDDRTQEGMHIRWYIHNDRLYVLMVLHARNATLQLPVERFFDSFQFI